MRTIIKFSRGTTQHFSAFHVYCAGEEGHAPTPLYANRNPADVVEWRMMQRIYEFGAGHRGQSNIDSKEIDGFKRLIEISYDAKSKTLRSIPPHSLIALPAGFPASSCPFLNGQPTMTAAELIYHLKKLPPQTPIGIYDGEWGCYNPIEHASLTPVNVDGESVSDTEDKSNAQNIVAIG